MKQMFRECWERSDSCAGFAAALEEQGFLLARGERRGFVAVDANGKIWSLSRWCRVKPKELRNKLGLEEHLPSVGVACNRLKDRPSPRETHLDRAFEKRRKALVASQRTERDELRKVQDRRRIEELKAQNSRLPRGLKAVLARVTGQYQSLQKEIVREADKAEVRDQADRQTQIARHLEERQALRHAARRRGLSIAFNPVDPRQKLTLRNDDSPFSRAQLVRDPTLVLNQISKTKAQFKKSDIQRELGKKIIDPDELSRATKTALASLCLTSAPAASSAADIAENPLEVRH